MDPLGLDIYRWLNLVTGTAVMLITLVTMVYRWKTMRPSQRLFSMAFVMYVGISVVLTAVAIANGVETIWWRSPALLIANVWLFGAIWALHHEWRHDQKTGLH